MSESDSSSSESEEDDREFILVTIHEFYSRECCGGGPYKYFTVNSWQETGKTIVVYQGTHLIETAVEVADGCEGGTVMSKNYEVLEEGKPFPILTEGKTISIYSYVKLVGMKEG